MSTWACQTDPVSREPARRPSLPSLFCVGPSPKRHRPGSRPGRAGDAVREAVFGRIHLALPPRGLERNDGGRGRSGPKRGFRRESYAHRGLAPPHDLRPTPPGTARHVQFDVGRCAPGFGEQQQRATRRQVPHHDVRLGTLSRLRERSGLKGPTALVFAAFQHVSPLCRRPTGIAPPARDGPMGNVPKWGRFAAFAAERRPDGLCAARRHSIQGSTRPRTRPP